MLKLMQGFKEVAKINNRQEEDILSSSMKLQVIALEMQANPLPYSYTDLTANFKTEKKIFALLT